MEERVNVVEQRMGAMERAIIVAMEEVDNTRNSLNERLTCIEEQSSIYLNNNNNSNNNNSEREEILRMSSEALAISQAQKQKMQLYELRYNALEKELEALRSQINDRMCGIEIQMNEQSHEVERALRTLEESRVRNMHLIEETIKERCNEIIISNNNNSVIIISQLQERITKLEQQQQQQQQTFSTRNFDGIEDHVKSIVETHFRKLLREQQQQESFKNTSITNNNNNNNNNNNINKTLLSVSGALDVRSFRNDINILRQDLVRCVVEIEKLMDQHQRLGSRVHNCMNMVQKHQLYIEELPEKQETLIQSHINRIENQQMTVFTRQEKQIEAEIEMIPKRIAVEVQKCYEQQQSQLFIIPNNNNNNNTSQIQQKTPQYYHLEDIVTAQDRLRDELHISIGKQREELKLATEQFTNTTRHIERDVVSQLLHETSKQLNNSKQKYSSLLDEAKRHLEDSQIELRKLQGIIKDNETTQQEHDRRLESLLQTRIDDEIRRLRKNINESSLRLQQQVEQEVNRQTRIVEQQSLPNIKQDINRIEITLQTLEEQYRELREAVMRSMSNVPSTTMISLDQRINIVKDEVRAMGKMLNILQKNQYQQQQEQEEENNNNKNNNNNNNENNNKEKLALTYHILNKQQRLLQDDVLEIKSRLRRCEECCGVNHNLIMLEGNNNNNKSPLVIPYFPSDNATHHTPVRTNTTDQPPPISTQTLLSSSIFTARDKKKEERNFSQIENKNINEPIGRVFRTSGINAGLNHSTAFKITPNGYNSINSSTYDPLAGVFD